MPQESSVPGFEAVPAIPEQRVEVPESGADFESAKAAGERLLEPAPASVAPTASFATAPLPLKDPAVLAVEHVLEEDLSDAFRKMPPELQATFRKEGERVTSIIVAMVRNAKVNARVVLKLIAGWLKLIPGVNHFFLVQEAKIKTDKVLKL